MEIIKLPDPVAVARREADAIRQNRDYIINHRLERTLADAPHIAREDLLKGLVAFHRERMLRVPPVAVYPEAGPWIGHILAVDRELQALAGLSDVEMAIHRSLAHYVTFRGYRGARSAGPEKCRVAYFPETDRGELHIKNVDDPSLGWNPRPPPKETPVWQDPPARALVWDGVGSGLHFDDEPAEIFPLPVPAMCHALCDDVPGAVSFLTRYQLFWGGQNVVLRDARRRSVAIEKTSYNYIEVFEPDATGRSWCSGMACRDRNSPQGRYQAGQRQRYLDRFRLPSDGPDGCFWAACDKAESMLGDFMRQPGAIRADDVLRLFVTPFPEGLCKDGRKYHPAQALAEYTLITHAVLFSPDEKTTYTWQRGPLPGLEWPEAPHRVTVRRPGA